MTNTMLRIRGMKYMGRYKNLIDEQLVIGLLDKIALVDYFD